MGACTGSDAKTGLKARDSVSNVADRSVVSKSRTVTACAPHVQRQQIQQAADTVVRRPVRVALPTRD
jgi:hypothetical protein